MNDQGFVTRFRAALSQPFPADMGWMNLALVVGFILVVSIAWRQVILYIATRD